MICTFADSWVLTSLGRYYRYSELTAVEPESAEAEQDAVSVRSLRASAMPEVLATSVEAMLPEILADDCEP